MTRDDEHTSPRVRAFRELRSLDPDAAVASALEVLGDGDWTLSREAAELLRSFPRAGSSPAPAPGAPAALRRIAADRDAPRERRLWALFALAWMGEEVGELLSTLPDPRVPLPASVPQRVRETILRDASFQQVRPGTDVRWLIELCELGAFEDDCVEIDAAGERLSRVRAALRDEGLGHGPAVFPAALRQRETASQWVDSYAILEVEGHPVRFTEIGPFAAAERPLPTGLEPRVRRAVEAAGLLWLEPGVLDAELPGLVLEHYGEVRVWTVGEYLFFVTVAQP